MRGWVGVWCWGLSGMMRRQEGQIDTIKYSHDNICVKCDEMFIQITFNEIGPDSFLSFLTLLHIGMLSIRDAVFQLESRHTLHNTSQSSCLLFG